MFSTEIGSTAEGATKIYLRPETAQGIFVNFLNVQKSGRMKIPFGIAQIGKAFRMNCSKAVLSSGCVSLSRMEIAVLCQSRHWTWVVQTLERCQNEMHQALGSVRKLSLPWSWGNLHITPMLPAIFEYKFPFGFKEVEGIHSRTDFWPEQHQEYSGKKMQYFDPEKNEIICPVCYWDLYRAWQDVSCRLFQHHIAKKSLRKRMVQLIPGWCSDCRHILHLSSWQ